MKNIHRIIEWFGILTEMLVMAEKVNVKTELY